MPAYRDVQYRAADGAELYARDYGGDGPPVLCMHGLTRNSRDFEGLAETLGGRWRLIVPDQRGRGRSAWAEDPARYNTLVYVEDMWTLLAHLGVEGGIGVVGTSMGGLMGMLMAAAQPGRIWGLVLNDIGPVVDAAGIERIRSYVGRPAPAKDWTEAAARAKAINGAAHPDYGDAEWLAMAQRLFREYEPGAISPDYDPAIGEAMKAAPVAPGDMWPLFEAIKTIPMLVIRGALSDLLSAETVAEMQARSPVVDAIEVPRTGHTPTLAEPPLVAAIAGFLERNAP